MSADVLSVGDGARAQRGDGMMELADALLAYLLEIDDYRDVCLRSEESAIVRATSHGLEVIRYYAHRDEVLTHLRASLGRLSNGLSDEHHRENSGAVTTFRAHDHSRSHFQGSFIWENHPALVNVTVPEPDATRLRVCVLLPSLQNDVSELPLRMLANALRCHECLMPAAVATALSVQPDATTLTLRDYLKRTMPCNLYASQWICNAGAG